MLDVKLDDLMRDCPKCHGTGEYTGRDANYTETAPCMDCRARGYTLTPAGEVLEAFVLHVRR